MSYEYDGNSGSQPQPPKKNNNDLGSWILIAVMFAVAWPVGLILLLSKLSEGGGRKMRQQAREAWQRTAAGSAEAKPAQARASAAKNTVRKVTETPNYSDKGAKTMKIIGAVVGILGCVAMLSAVSDNLSYAYHYNEWWYFARQLFYPMGMMAGGASLLLGSGAMKRRQRRFATYLRTVGQKQAVPLDYLARAADVSRKRVEKDVNLMLEKGMWGDEAYIDLGSGMLFKSQEAATAYFDAAHRAKAEQEQPQQPAAAAPEGYAAILAQIRDLNDRIADEHLSAQMDRMEQVAGRIFRLIEEDENKRAAAGTFLSYYLPTTLKLLRSYDELSRQGVSGQNITGTMEKVEGMMDTIVLAFEKQLDGLFGDQAMDISTDITVLDNMMAREGLTGGDALHKAAQENPVSDPEPELDIRSDSGEADGGITLQL